MARCQWVSLDILEQMTLFLYRVSEFCSRSVALTYLWYGLDSCFHCQTDYCTCMFRWVALPAVGTQFLLTLIVTSSEHFWLMLCNEAPRSFFTTLEVVFNVHFAATIVNSMGCYYTSGDGEIVGQGAQLRFLGELRFNEGIVLIILHVAVNSVLMILSGLVVMYDEPEAQRELYTHSFEHLMVNMPRRSFFFMAAGGTGLMIVAIAVRYFPWLTHVLACTSTRARTVQRSRDLIQICIKTEALHTYPRRYLIWRTSAYGLEMRAKKVLIDLILGSHHAQKHGLSQAVLMNYNFSLDQLKQIQEGDLSNLASSKNPDDIKDIPYPLIDTKEQVRLKDAHVITESEQKEMLDKQVRAVRKLKEDFGLQDIGTFTKRRQEQVVVCICASIMTNTCSRHATDYKSCFCHA